MGKLLDSIFAEAEQTDSFDEAPEAVASTAPPSGRLIDSIFASASEPQSDFVGPPEAPTEPIPIKPAPRKQVWDLQRSLEEAGYNIKETLRRWTSPSTGGLYEFATEPQHIAAIAEREMTERGQPGAQTLMPALMKHLIAPSDKSFEVLKQASERGLFSPDLLDAAKRAWDRQKQGATPAEQAGDASVEAYRGYETEQIGAMLGNFLEQSLKHLGSALGFVPSVGLGAVQGALGGATEALQTGEVNPLHGALQGAEQEAGRRAGNFYTAWEDKQGGETVARLEEFMAQLFMKEQRERGAPITHGDAIKRAQSGVAQLLNPVVAFMRPIVEGNPGVSPEMEQFYRDQVAVGRGYAAGGTEVFADPQIAAVAGVRAVAKVPEVARGLMQFERWARGGSGAPVVNVSREAVQQAREAGQVGELSQGVVRGWSGGRGQIRPVGGGEDILVEADDLNNARTLRIGDVVEYRPHVGTETSIATNVLRLDDEALTPELSALQRLVASGDDEPVKALRGAGEADSFLGRKKQQVQRAVEATGRGLGSLFQAADYWNATKHLASGARFAPEEIQAAARSAGFTTPTGEADLSAFRRAFLDNDPRLAQLDPTLVREAVDPTSNSNLATSMYERTFEKRGTRNMWQGHLERAKKDGDEAKETLAAAMVDELHTQDEVVKATRGVELNEQLRDAGVSSRWFDDYQTEAARGVPTAARRALAARLGRLAEADTFDNRIMQAADYLAWRGMATGLMESRVVQGLDLESRLRGLLQAEQEMQGARSQARLFRQDTRPASAAVREQYAPGRADLDATYNEAISEVRAQLDLDAQAIRAAGRGSRSRDDIVSEIDHLREGAEHEIEVLRQERDLARGTFAERQAADVEMATQGARSDVSRAMSIARRLAREVREETRGVFREARHEHIGAGWRRLEPQHTDSELFKSLEVEGAFRTQQTVDRVFGETIGPALRARIAKKIRPELFVHRDLIPQLENFKRLAVEPGKLLRFLGAAQNEVKGLMLARAGTVSNNVVEDTTKGFMFAHNAAEFPKRVREADAVLWAGAHRNAPRPTRANSLFTEDELGFKPATPDYRVPSVRVGNTDIPAARIHDEFAKYGLIGNVANRAGQDARSKQVLRYVHNVTSMGFAIVQPRLEDAIKVATGIDSLIKSGKFDKESIIKAVQKAQQVHFAWDEQTGAMRLANIFPFAQYAAKTAAMMTKYVAQNPAAANRWMKFVADKERDPVEESTYRRGQTGFPITFTDATGLQQTIFLRWATPFEAGSQFLTDPWNYAADQFGTPLIEAGVEAARPESTLAKGMWTALFSLPQARQINDAYQAIEEGRVGWATMTPTEKLKLQTRLVSAFLPIQIASWSPDLERYYRARDTNKQMYALHKYVGAQVQRQLAAERAALEAKQQLEQSYERDFPANDRTDDNPNVGELSIP